MNSIQCRILVFLVLLISCFSPVYGKDKKPLQAIEKLSIDGPYLLKADDGSMRAISVDGKGRLLDKHYKSIPTTFSFEVFSDNGERLFPVTYTRSLVRNGKMCNQRRRLFFQIHMRTGLASPPC